MSQPRTTRIPAPLYAVAGAGDLAYRQLRKLPEVVTDLSGKAVNTTVELREKAVTSTTGLREKAAATLRAANTTAANLREKATTQELDVERLREVATRNTAAFVAGAQAAQERAVAVYGALVAHGERVVGTGVVQAAETVNADIEATEAPAEVTATPADVAEIVQENAPVAKAAKPAKRTRATAK
ncbi:hypothetical protein [Micromonospora sp. NPDC049679]|uniref:hypothetical protein n=1 Tax=Micromonospora sp. NPDC049679 TaxID=3155920 RepID=UPI0033E77DA7